MWSHKENAKRFKNWGVKPQAKNNDRLTAEQGSIGKSGTRKTLRKGGKSNLGRYGWGN